MKKILITGGASGLGQALTRAFASDRANQVYFTYFRAEDPARELSAEFSNAQGFRCDFSSEAEVAALLARVPDFGLDVLINNAVAGMNKTHFQKIPSEEFLASFAKNVQPTLLLTQAALSDFRKRRSGRVITILTSYLGQAPTGLSEYVANKSYLESMAKSWASENVRLGITSNCISPSFMQTGLTAGEDERIIEELVKSHPLKRLLTTTEVAETALFLASCSPHINGINLVMDAK